MRRIARYLPLCLLALGSMQFAAAQSQFDVNIGFGAYHAKAQKSGIDSGGAFCTLGTTGCTAAPSLSGFFMGFGGSLMLQKHYGVGGEWVLTPARSDYGPLQFRQHFYDINGIYAPINEKKFALNLLGGIGGAKTGFSFTQTSCVGTAVCQSQTYPFASSNHFQLHLGVAAQIFVTDHVFVKPEFDYHFVPGLTDQFGTNHVPGGMIWLGYSWGDR